MFMGLQHPFKPIHNHTDFIMLPCFPKHNSLYFPKIPGGVGGGLCNFIITAIDLWENCGFCVLNPRVIHRRSSECVESGIHMVNQPKNKYVSLNQTIWDDVLTARYTTRFHPQKGLRVQLME